MSKFEFAKLDGITVDKDGNISATVVKNAKGGKATDE
jgi:hypothetical protein